MAWWDDVIAGPSLAKKIIDGLNKAKAWPGIPVHGLFAADGKSLNTSVDARGTLASAQMIYARDVTTKQMRLVFDDDAIKDGGTKEQPITARTIVFELDKDSGEFDSLCELVRNVKGKCDPDAMWL